MIKNLSQDSTNLSLIPGLNKLDYPPKHGPQVK